MLRNSKSAYICTLYKSNTRLPGTATSPTPAPQPTTLHAQRLYLSLLFGCIQKRAREHVSYLNSRLTFGSDCLSVEHSKEHLCIHTPTNIVLLANYPYTDSSNPTRGDSSKCLLKLYSNKPKCQWTLPAAWSRPHLAQVSSVAILTFSRLMTYIYIYMSYRTANLQMLRFI